MSGSWSSALSKIVCNVIGNVYPAYASYLAVREADPEEHKQWLMYWIVNTVFIIFEMLADQLISWVPLYWEGKIAFVLWLTLPRFRGATYLYEQAVAPYITQYEGDIDKHLASLADSASAGVAKLKEAGAHHLRQHSTQALTLMAEMVSPRGTTAPALSDIHEGADAAPPAHAAAPARAGVDSEGVLQEGPNGFDADAKPASTLRQRRK